jgi:hypothetical protein
MATDDVARKPLTVLVERLSTEHEGMATRSDVAAIVRDAASAVQLFGPPDDDMLAIVEVIAARELRIRVGLERDGARLDPETRNRTV